MEERIERMFTVGADASLTLENIIGDICVTAWERPDIHVIAVQRGRTKAEIEMRQEGSHVAVRTVHNRWWSSLLRWLGGERPPVVDYTVEVPAGCRVHLSAVDGAVSLAGLRPETHLSLVSGRVQAEALDGEADISLVSAHLDGKELRGRATIKTVSGDLRLERCQLDSLDVDTVSGRAYVATPLAPQGRYHFHSVSGDVVLVVPAGTRATIMGESVSGRVRSDMLASIEWHGLGSWRATLNGGGVEVHFNSVSGDLILTTDDGRRTTERVAAPAAPVTEAPEPPPMTTMDVLKAVEAGQMTVDEALRRLNKSA
ncbi:MAG: hypothetical protein C4311_10655 [Chloroflexota bacterium]